MEKRWMGGIKAQALITTARAFYQRGEHIQYDQLNMDRLVRITPRRNKYASPEQANAQHRLFLDCSSFVFATYYNAFNYELEADITWRMMDLVKPCVYRYEPTHTETPEQQKNIGEEIIRLLQPGDCMVMEFISNGHVMLYGGDGIFYHCTQKNNGSSFNYEERRDFFSPCGAIHIDSSQELFLKSGNGAPGKFNIFTEKVKRFCVLRPIENVGEPTAEAIARIESAEDLICSALSSHPGGCTAMVNDTVEYRVSVYNSGKAERPVHVEVSAPEGCKLLSHGMADCTLPPNKEWETAFAMRIERACGAYMQPPVVNVNNLRVWAERVLLCPAHDNNMGADAALAVQATIKNGKDVMAAASSAYAKYGIAIPGNAQTALNNLFMRHDSALGDVLWRMPQQPERDMAVYSYFGGTGVITPEAARLPDVRTKKVLVSDLQPGDVIICSDDACFANAYACVFTGVGIFGKLESDAQCIEANSAQTDAFLESLLGRFCFIVLRPCLGVKHT